MNQVQTRIRDWFVCHPLVPEWTRTNHSYFVFRFPLGKLTGYECICAWLKRKSSMNFKFDFLCLKLSLIYFMEAIKKLIFFLSAITHVKIFQSNTNEQVKSTLVQISHQDENNFQAKDLIFKFLKNSCLFHSWNGLIQSNMQLTALNSVTFCFKIGRFKR